MAYEITRAEAEACLRDWIADNTAQPVFSKRDLHCMKILLGDVAPYEEEDHTRIAVEITDLKTGQTSRTSVSTAAQLLAVASSIAVPGSARPVKHYAAMLVSGTRVSTPWRAYQRVPSEPSARPL